MKKRGFTLVEIMIVVAIIALLAIMAIPNLLRARVNSNDAVAQATLKTIATGIESFASANNGNYPTTWADITNSTPPYVNENYETVGSRNGYTISCSGNMTTAGYTCTAEAVTCNTTGTKDFTITTGAVLTSAGC